MSKLLITNIGELTTPEGNAARAGAAQKEIRLLKHAYLAAEDGIITSLGEGSAPAHLTEGAEVIDAKNRLVTPGLVDPHTHLVFGGWREHELALKLKGVPYLDILKAGGGILSTVRHTRAESEDRLVEKTLPVLKSMLELGATTCEAKSGYGLSLEDELKQLSAAKRLHDCQPVELVSTFMAAHAVPEEYQEKREDYLRLVSEEMIPAVAKSGLATFCDVFCESGIFSAEESRRILLAGQKAGLKSKIHADEIDPIGGAELAGEIGAISAEHLIAATDQGIAALKAGGVIACLLPGTSFYLDKPFARARDMIASGVAVAIGSDFNPGSCPNLSLQLTMNIACYKYKMQPAEVLSAVTLNAAAAVGRAEQIGSLEAGKQADILIWDAPNLDFIFYRFGNNLVDTVIKKGVRVHSKQE